MQNKDSGSSQNKKNLNLSSNSNIMVYYGRNGFQE